MTPTEKLKATMAALGISAEGIIMVDRDYGGVKVNFHDSWTVLLPSQNLLHSAIQIARLFGRER